MLSLTAAGCGGAGNDAPRTTPGLSPAASAEPATVPADADPDKFLTVACPAAAMAEGTRIGIAVPRAARLYAGPSAEANTFAGLLRCLRQLHGTGGAAASTSEPARWRPLLRTQLPIDALRRTGRGGNELAELHAFGRLLQETGSDGVVSVMSHDFTRCGRGGAPRASARTQLGPGEALASCQYPSPGLYRELFGELVQELTRAAPGAQLHWTAWNEPDHPAFTFTDAFGTIGAARQAGAYWSEAAGLVGPGNLLGGDFADRSPQLLARLRAAFVEGAGAEPAAWSIHPYRDLTAGESTDAALDRPGGEAERPSTPASTTPQVRAMPTTDAFTAAVAPAPVWLTEVAPLLSSRRGIGGDVTAQRGAGETLRAQAQRTATIATLFSLMPSASPGAGGSGWDSSPADRQGRARPFICGLAALPPEACTGSPEAYG